MTSEYQPEHIIGAMLELRDNRRIEDRVSKFIKEKGWSYVIELLRKGRELVAIVPGWDIPLRKGVLRDGMIELLHLQDFMGLDVDFVDAFAVLEPMDLDDLRSQAREKAMDLMREQVKRGLTFFMDLEVMADTEFAVLVPDALEARMREVQRLGSKPHLYEIYSTYYGLKVMTSGGVHYREAGVPEEIQENLSDILGELGGVQKVESKQLKFSPFAFPKCSPHLSVLLWNMLRVSLGGQKYKERALRKLGELGDSRALEFLHRIFDSFGYSLTGIVRIGHPSSFDFLNIRSRMDLNSNSTLESISEIRHPAIIEKIQERLSGSRVYRSHWKYSIPVINAAGRTRLRLWIPSFERFLEGRKMTKVRQAIEKAQRNMHPPFEEEAPV